MPLKYGYPFQPPVPLEAAKARTRQKNEHNACRDIYRAGANIGCAIRVFRHHTYPEGD